MLALLSPAKKLRFDFPAPSLHTVAPLLTETRHLAKVVKALSTSELKRMMHLSDTLAELNFQRFQSLKAIAQPKGSQPAALAFDGDTYVGLRAREFSEADMAFAQEHIGILSGLYGLLRPLDLISPYRLEMGTHLKTKRGKNLYEFWGDRIAHHINQRLVQVKSDVVINLASAEYYAAVSETVLKARVITPVFKEERKGKLKVISFSAKRARGAMARYLVLSRLSRPDGLKKFCQDGYRFDSSTSDDKTWTYLRKQP